MRVAFIVGDLVALSGVTSPALVLAHVLPDAALVLTSLSATLGGVWYAVMLWDRFKNHKPLT